MRLSVKQNNKFFVFRHDHRYLPLVYRQKIAGKFLPLKFYSPVEFYRGESFWNQALEVSRETIYPSKIF